MKFISLGRHCDIAHNIDIVLYSDPSIEKFNFKCVIHYDDIIRPAKKQYVLRNKVISYHNNVAYNNISWYPNITYQCIILQISKNYKQKIIDTEYPVIKNVVLTYNKQIVLYEKHNIVECNIYDTIIYIVPLTKAFSTWENIRDTYTVAITHDKYIPPTKKEMNLKISYESSYDLNAYHMHYNSLYIDKII